MRDLTRWMAILGVFTLFAAGSAGAAEQPVRCFLVDARVHVAVVSAGEGTEGELVWRDTVTGESGGEPFTADGDRLLFHGDHAAPVTARLLPDLAIVLEHPPWAPDVSVPSLGVALN